MITFYINKTKTPHALANLLLTLEGSIYIHCDNEAHAKSISDEIWAHPSRFIPNSLDITAPSVVILLGYSVIPNRDHIINASKQFVKDITIEWVADNIDSAREHYRLLKDAKHPLETVSI